jgi:hypothetical protein
MVKTLAGRNGDRFRTLRTAGYFAPLTDAKQDSSGSNGESALLLETSLYLHRVLCNNLLQAGRRKFLFKNHFGT